MKKQLSFTLFCVIGLPIVEIIAYLLVYHYQWVEYLQFHAHKRFLFGGSKFYESLALIGQLIIFIFLYFGLQIITMLVEKSRIRIVSGIILMSVVSLICALQFPSTIWGLTFFFNMVFNGVFYWIYNHIYQKDKLMRSLNRFIPL